MPLRAELFRSSRVNNVDDWIDIGQPPVKPHWLGTVAHSAHPSVHPIVEECGADCCALSHRFDQKRRNQAGIP